MKGPGAKKVVEGFSPVLLSIPCHFYIPCSLNRRNECLAFCLEDSAQLSRICVFATGYSPGGVNSPRQCSTEDETVDSLHSPLPFSFSQPPCIILVFEVGCCYCKAGIAPRLIVSASIFHALEIYSTLIEPSTT